MRVQVSSWLSSFGCLLSGILLYMKGEIQPLGKLDFHSQVLNPMLRVQKTWVIKDKRSAAVGSHRYSWRRLPRRRRALGRVWIALSCISLGSLASWGAHPAEHEVEALYIYKTVKLTFHSSCIILDPFNMRYLVPSRCMTSVMGKIYRTEDYQLCIIIVVAIAESIFAVWSCLGNSPQNFLRTATTSEESNSTQPMLN